MFHSRDETGNSNEGNKQEAGLVHQEFLSFIVCILFFFPLSASKDKEESIQKNTQMSVNRRMPPSTSELRNGSA